MNTRFAPSPTGYLHLGNIRTALFNWLAAKSSGGDMQLRFEDTDKNRNQAHYIDAIEEDLAWLGMDWRGDENGAAWRQSRRLHEYERALAVLTEKEQAYPCFCTPEALLAQRQAQRAAGKPPRYDGACAGLSPATVADRLKSGEKAAWRFRMPARRVDFDDAVRGRLSFAGEGIGDFVIRRANGDFSFLLANAVDDHLCGVTLALRGDDHIANTPRQIALLETLDMTPPRYGHIPLVVNDKGRPLAKRDGLTAVREWRQRGFLADGILNYLVRLGHSISGHDDFLPRQELAEHFQLSALGRAPARYDAAQLERRQKDAVMRLNDDEFCDWLGAERLSGLATTDVAGFCRLVRDNTLLPDDALDWKRIINEEIPAADTDTRRWLDETPAEFFTVAADNGDAEDWKTFTKIIGAATQTRGKDLFMPLRVALTGRTDGPAMATLYDWLSAEKRRQRLRQAAQP